MLRPLQWACALVVLGGSSAELFAAAALANGAATSCKPTSTNPVQRQIQMNADPDGISDFQFTMHFDPTLVTPQSDAATATLVVTAVNGYVLGSRATSGDGGDGYAIDLVRGYITVRGYYPMGPAGTQVPSNELDVFSVNFKLASGLPLDTVLNFDCLGVPADLNPFGVDDYMNQGQFGPGGDVVVTRRFSAADPANPILPSSSGPVMIAPEPGDLGLLIPVALIGIASRRRTA